MTMATFQEPDQIQSRRLRSNQFERRGQLDGFVQRHDKGADAREVPRESAGREVMNIRPRVRAYFDPTIDWDCIYFCWGVCVAVSEGWGAIACMYGCRFVCDYALMNPN